MEWIRLYSKHHYPNLLVLEPVGKLYRGLPVTNLEIYLIPRLLQSQGRWVPWSQRFLLIFLRVREKESRSGEEKSEKNESQKETE